MFIRDKGWLQPVFCVGKMNKKKLFLSILFLSLPLSACGTNQAVVSPATPDPTETTSPLPVAPSPFETTQPSAIPSQVSNAPGPARDAALFLTIDQPMDEITVDTAQVEVAGKAPPNSVVTVNDEILIVGLSGEFKVPLALEEGPNLLEIIASDMDGNETSQLLTVFYEP